MHHTCAEIHNLMSWVYVLKKVFYSLIVKLCSINQWFSCTLLIYPNQSFHKHCSRKHKRLLAQACEIDPKTWFQSGSVASWSVLSTHSFNLGSCETSTEQLITRVNPTVSSLTSSSIASIVQGPRFKKSCLL